MWVCWAMRLMRISGLPWASRQYGTTEPKGKPGIDLEWVESTPRYSLSSSSRAGRMALVLTWGRLLISG
ncbi:hypothetical protein D3C85_1741230 [compost metagenome]